MRHLVHAEKPTRVCVTCRHIQRRTVSLSLYLRHRRETGAARSFTPSQQIPLSLTLLARIVFGGLFLCLAGAVQAQVYRCGSSYSHAPCKGGQVVDTSPVLSDPRGPRTKEIYLCSVTPGRNYWSSAHCSERGWRIERIERVPADMPWEEQVAAASQAYRSASSALAAPVQRASQAPLPAAQPAKEQCRALDERVKRLDSMGRAGSLHYDLDRVRHERKQARDQQYRLRC